MPDYTSKGIQYPVSSDRIKDGNVVAKLADDIKAVAQTANTAIIEEGARAEAAARWFRGAVPIGTDLNNMFGKTWRGLWGIGEDTTGEQIGSLLNLPELQQGTVEVTSTDTGFSFQLMRPFNRAYFYYRSQSSLAKPAWTIWAKVPLEVHKPIPNGTNIDHMANSVWRGDWGVGEDTTGTQIGSLIGLPEVVQGTISVKATNTGFSNQIFYPYNRDYFWYRAARTISSTPANTLWRSWVKIGGSQSESSGNLEVKHSILEQELRRFYGRPALGNAIPVTMIFDHGTNVFKSSILPALISNNLDATLALNSDMYNPSDPRYAHNTNTTWAEINGWPVEISNHGRTHGNQTTVGALETEIVGGLAELKANLPAKRIYTWTQTGQGAGAWMGFENGANADSWVASPAGRMVLENHAASTGAIKTSRPALYDMQGDIKQGVWGYWLDTPTGIATAKTRIAEAIAQGRGIILRCHPEVLGGSGNSTVAEVVTFLGWLAAEQSAGRVKSLTFGQWSIASF